MLSVVLLTADPDEAARCSLAGFFTSMSLAKHDDQCPGCKPILMDLRGAAVPDSSPHAQALQALWAETTQEQREAFHRFTCDNSRDSADVNFMIEFACRLKERLLPLPPLPEPLPPEPPPLLDAQVQETLASYGIAAGMANPSFDPPSPAEQREAAARHRHRRHRP